jgi:hypothetical protein
LFLTLALTRVLSKLFSYLNQPVVIGEIVAGIIMGPSVLGHIPGEPPGGGGMASSVHGRTTYRNCLRLLERGVCGIRLLSEL